MKKLIVIVSLFIASAQAWAQKTETRALSTFTQIEISGGFDVVLRHADVNQVKIVSKKLPLSEITTQQIGSTLKIGRQLKFKNFTEAPSTKLYIDYMGPLTNIRINGAGDVLLKDAIEVTNLYIQLNGACRMQGKVNNTKKLKVKLSGSAELNLNGEVNILEIQAMGSAQANLLDLKAGNATVKSLGSADLKIYVRHKLDARTTGSGNIYYDGRPSSVNAKTFGSGKVRKHNMSSEEEEDDDDF